MKYFHCPTKFRNKAYGCGFGPVNATQAFLDLGNTCPKCGKALKTHRKPKVQAAYRAFEHGSALEFVEKMFGTEAAKRYSAEKKRGV